MRSLSTAALCAALALGAQNIPAPAASAEVAQQESSKSPEESSNSPEIITPIAVFAGLAIVAILGNLIVDLLNRNTYRTLFTNVI